MADPWMKSEIVPRCENCGKRLEDGTTGLCKSCAYRRAKQEQRTAASPPPTPTPAELEAKTKAPDVEELKERFRKVQEGLLE